MKKITKRDILFFFAGVFAMLVFEIVYDWDEFAKGFNSVWNEGHAKGVQEQAK